jgi:hypothetical protein
MSTQVPKAVLDDPDARSRLVTALTEGQSLTKAAAAIGLSRMAIRKYRIAHPDFDEVCRLATGAAPIPADEAIVRKVKQQQEKAVRRAAREVVEYAEEAPAVSRPEPEPLPELPTIVKTDPGALAQALTNELESWGPTPQQIVDRLWSIAGSEHPQAVGALNTLVKIKVFPLLAERDRSFERARQIQAMSSEEDGLERGSGTATDGSGLVILVVPKKRTVVDADVIDAEVMSG